MKTRSDAEKRSFAFLASAVITFFIFCIWLIGTISFYNHQNGVSVKNQANPISLLIEEVTKPFSSQKNIYQNK